MDSRTVAALPTFAAVSDPQFGADIPALADVLFAGEPRGLMQLPDDGGLAAVRNDDLTKLMSDPAFGNVPAVVMCAEDDLGFYPMLYNHVFTMNPPMHGPHRKAFSKPMTAAAVKGLIETADQVVAEVVAEALERGTVEFNADVAAQTTSRFWGRLIGMTQEEEQLIAEVVAGDFSLNFLFARTEEQTEATRKANIAYLDTVRGAILRSLQTGDNAMIGTMAADIDAMELQERSEDVGLLLGASLADGFHTLAGALTNITYALITRPDQLNLVRADEGLIPAAFNEGTRLDPPLISTGRFTIADTELNGTEVPEGQYVMTMWMFGNLDPLVFDDPGDYVLARDTRRARPFGGGIHNCPGRNVSRMLGCTLLRHLTAPGIHLEPVGGDPRWITGSLLHELDGGFPVAFKTA